MEKHGYTKGCPGCLAILRRIASQAHDENCLRRFEIEVKDSEKVINAKRRVDEHSAKLLEVEGQRKKTRRVDVQEKLQVEAGAEESGEGENRKRVAGQQ